MGMADVANGRDSARATGRTHDSPRVVLIGAGIVGCALADELTARGWTDVTVARPGPAVRHRRLQLARARAWSSRPTASKTMTEFARYTVEKYSALTLDGAWCFRPGRRARGGDHTRALADLHRRHGFATSWGIEAPAARPRRVRRAAPAARPATRSSAACTSRPTGSPRPLRAGEAQARRATDAGARFLGHHEVVGIAQEGGAVTGVRHRPGHVPRRHRRVLRRLLGAADRRAWPASTVPLLPMAHQYAKTGPVPALAGRNDAGAARRPRRSCATRTATCTSASTATGSASAPTATGPMPVDAGELAVTPTRRRRCRRCCRSPPDDFAAAWAAAVELLPAPRATRRSRRASTASSRSPRTGCRCSASHRTWRGFWVGRGRVGHPLGRRRRGRRGVDRRRARPRIDLHECDLQPLRGRPARAGVRRASAAARTSSRSTTSSTRSQPPDVAAPAAHQPVPRRASVELGAVLPRGRRAGSGRTGTRPTPACPTVCGSRPGARRLVGPLLVADRRRRGAGHPRARRRCTT